MDANPFGDALEAVRGDAAHGLQRGSSGFRSLLNTMSSPCRLSAAAAVCTMLLVLLVSTT